MENDNFVAYRSFRDAIYDFDDADQLKLFHAVFDYALDGVEPELEGFSNTLWKSIKPQIDANNNKRERGKNGGINTNTDEVVSLVIKTQKKRKKTNIKTNVKTNMKTKIKRIKAFVLKKISVKVLKTLTITQNEKRKNQAMTM